MFAISRPRYTLPVHLRNTPSLRVLVCGAQGWIGHAVMVALQKKGHTVLAGQRAHPKQNASHPITPMNFLYDIQTDIWIPRLQGIDVVVNAVGIFSAPSKEHFQRVHVDTPMALFEACKRVGVRRIVHISARINPTRDYFSYLATKQAGEALLHHHYKNWIIIRPSMVIGEQGRTSAAFRSWASLPLLGIPAQATGPFQPIGLNDLVELIVAAVEGHIKEGTTLDAAGPTTTNYHSLLMLYRQSLGLPPAHSFCIPAWLARMATSIAVRVEPHGVMSPDALKLLEIGSTADTKPAEKVLGRPLMPLQPLIDALESPGNRAWAIQSWIRWFIRCALFLVWIISAFALFISPAPVLPEHIGIPNTSLFPVFILAGLLNIGFGILTLIRPSQHLWMSQAGWLLLQTLILTLTAPHLWLDPLGPFIKNFPIYICLLYLWATEDAP